jgi:hypothetical protein
MADEIQTPDDQGGNSKIPPAIRPYAWKPGQSGNPKGRPKGRIFEARIRKILQETDDASGMTFEELIVRALVDAARFGDVKAIREVLDRTDGKVPDAKPESSDDDPLIVAEMVRAQYAPEDEDE